MDSEGRSDGSDASTDREAWNTRTGFILATTGLAVGLGNVWRFPVKTAQEGGAAFVVVYLLFVLAIGLPLLLLELSVGKQTNLSPVAAFESLASGVWSYLGWPMLASVFLILSYYTVVAGWTLRYAVSGLARGYPQSGVAAESWFLQVSSGADAVVFQAIFLLLTAAVVALGVRRGIEVISMVLVPISAALLVALVAYASGLSGSEAAYVYYLEPDFGVVADNWRTILPAAAGQAFFTLSLGGGLLLTYASYVEEDRSLLGDGVLIAGLDTVIAVVVGLIVFPILFTAGVSPSESGHSAMFLSLSRAFGSVEEGAVLGFLFFGAVALAALLTAVAMLEVLVAHLIDDEDFGRLEVLAGVVALVFVAGVPSATSLTVLDLVDVFATHVLLLATMFAVTAYVSWNYGEESAEAVFGDRTREALGGRWIWYLRGPVLVILALTFGYGLLQYGLKVRELAIEVL